MSGPAYKLDDLVAACASPGKVYVREEARQDAQRYFRLATEEQILASINNGFLEKPVHFNTEPFRKWRGKPPPPLVDAYSFFTGPMCGYIAFFLNHMNNCWMIKSLKKNTVCPPRNLALRGPLLKLLADIDNKDDDDVTQG